MGSCLLPYIPLGISQTCDYQFSSLPYPCPMLLHKEMHWLFNENIMSQTSCTLFQVKSLLVFMWGTLSSEYLLSNRWKGYRDKDSSCPSVTGLLWKIRKPSANKHGLRHMHVRCFIDARRGMQYPGRVLRERKLPIGPQEQNRTRYRSIHDPAW